MQSEQSCLASSLRIIKWRVRGRETDTILTQRAATGRHTFALQMKEKENERGTLEKKK